MNNAWDELHNALATSKAINYACDQNSNLIVELITGRLRKVSPRMLVKMKRELQEFNAATKRWKS